MDGRCIHHLRYSLGVCREPFPTSKTIMLINVAPHFLL
nr:MAG TPA: hypothetical protein [Caudoviricetes sp.]